MFTVMRDLRGLSVEVDALAMSLRDYLLRIDETLDNDGLYVHQQNRGQLHKIFARITDYVTMGSGNASNYIELTSGAELEYEVEQIWADQSERHTDDFSHEADFAHHRTRSGNLLLLPKQFNASYNDETYAEKRPRGTSARICSQPASIPRPTRRIRAS